MDSLRGILTGGLGAAACPHLIFGFFHLNCTLGPSPAGTHGGPPHVRPNTKGERLLLQRLEQIRRQQLEDDDIEIEQKQLITVVIRWKGNISERKYIVSKDRGERVVRVVNLLNRYIENISLMVSNWKRKLIEIKVKFTKR